MNYDLMSQELIRDEGKRNKLYRDIVGKNSIAVGRNLDDVGVRDDEIALMLKNDITRAWADVQHYLPWVKDLDEVRQRVLTNLTFNIGIHSLMGFHDTLGLIQAGKYQDAASAMLDSKWAKQVGARADRLAKMMETGEAV